MVTRETFEAANKRGKAMRQKYSRVIAASYQARLGTVQIDLSTGLGLLLDPKTTQGLERASAAEFRKIEVLGPGTGIRFPKLDVDLYIPGLIEGRFGSAKWAAAQLGKRGGRARTEIKKAAARENGKRGGRPRKDAALPNHS
jgi:hypothetical protein